MWISLVLFLAASAPTTSSPVVRVVVSGETNLTTNFIQSLRQAASEEGLTLEITDRTGPFNYRLLIAQETTIGSAAAAVIAIGRDCEVVASVVRSGRLSGKGALNACAKELVKRLKVLAAG